MTGFWPRVRLREDGLVDSMDGEVLGLRVHAPHRKDAVLLVVATMQCAHDNPGDYSAVHLLTPRAGTCWAWLESLFQKTLGNAVLL